MGASRQFQPADSTTWRRDLWGSHSGMRVEPIPDGVAIEVGSEAETERLGQALAELIPPGSVIGLVGPLGAGKTRLVRAVSEALGVDPTAIASPTYVLIHEYEGRLPIYHF